MIPAVVVNVLAVIGAVTVFCAVVVAWIVVADRTPVTESDEPGRRTIHIGDMAPGEIVTVDLVEGTVEREPSDVSWGFTRDEEGVDR